MWSSMVASPTVPVLSTAFKPKQITFTAKIHSISYSPNKLGSRVSSSSNKVEVSAQKKSLSGVAQPETEISESALSCEGNVIDGDVLQSGGLDVGWLPSFPHVFIASMANFLFGYHIGVMNGPIVSVARELGFEGSPILEGLVVSIFIAGAFIGSLSSGSLVDNFGCRRTLQIDTVPLIIGALLSAQAHSLGEILLGRFLVGLGIGVNTVLVPIYISEASPTRYRGSLGTLCQIGTCLGIIAALFLGIPSENDPHWWRIMFMVASFPGFLLIVGMQFAVESPRWLSKVGYGFQFRFMSTVLKFNPSTNAFKIYTKLEKGRWDEAKSVICRLWGESQVDNAMEEIQSVINFDGSDSEANWLELFSEPYINVAVIGGTLFVLQQFAGINGVLYFSSLTFQSVGITSSALASLFVGLTNFAGALLALYLMDKQGRQKLLIASYLGMAASMFLIVYAISFQPDEQLSHDISIVGTLAYIFSFATGAGPVTGLVIPELSSNRARAKTMAFSFSVHWVCNFFVGLFFLDLVEKFGLGAIYAGFGGVSLMSAIFAWYFIVETKGRSLEEIELSLNPNITTKDE